MTNSLIAVAINLVGMLLIYSLMANAITRFYWHGRGTISVLVTIIIAGVFWIVPTTIALYLDPKNADAVPYALWLGNWLISGFSIVIFCQTAGRIPRQLEDSARLDGCGWLGIYWRFILPLVQRELGLIALLTLMGTFVLWWSAPGPPPWFAWLSPISIGNASSPSLKSFLAEVMAAAIAATLPVMLVFFLSQRCLLRPTKLETE